MKYLTLIDNPWSKKGEIVIESVYDSITRKYIVYSEYPSIWQPIEEEEEENYPLDTLGIVPDRIEDGKDDLYSKIDELVDTLNSLTQRVKELEERDK